MARLLIIAIWVVPSRGSGPCLLPLAVKAVSGGVWRGAWGCGWVLGALASWGWRRHDILGPAACSLPRKYHIPKGCKIPPTNLFFALFAVVKKKKNYDIVANIKKERKTKISPQILIVWQVLKTNKLKLAALGPPSPHSHKALQQLLCSSRHLASPCGLLSVPPWRRAQALGSHCLTLRPRLCPQELCGLSQYLPSRGSFSIRETPAWPWPWED